MKKRVSGQQTDRPLINCVGQSNNLAFGSTATNYYVNLIHTTHPIAVSAVPKLPKLGLSDKRRSVDTVVECLGERSLAGEGVYTSFMSSPQVFTSRCTNSG